MNPLLLLVKRYVVCFLVPEEYGILVCVLSGAERLDPVEPRVLVLHPDLDPPLLAVARGVVRLHLAELVVVLGEVAQFAPRLVVVVDLAHHLELNSQAHLGAEAGVVQVRKSKKENERASTTSLNAIVVYADRAVVAAAANDNDDVFVVFVVAVATFAVLLVVASASAAVVVASVVVVVVDVVVVAAAAAVAVAALLFFVLVLVAIVVPAVAVAVAVWQMSRCACYLGNLTEDDFSAALFNLFLSSCASLAMLAILSSCSSSVCASLLEMPESLVA